MMMQSGARGIGRSAVRFARIPTLVLGMALVVPAVGGPGDPGGSARPGPHREASDDPPAAHVPKHDPTARSEAATVSFGPYVSVQVNVDGAGLNILGDAANETSIAVNPNDPGNIVIGWRQFDSILSNFRQAGWAYSLDGGAIWTFPGVLTPGLFRSDPVLDFDSSGNVYYQSLRDTFDVDVFKSVDGGASWGAPVSAFGGDKNWMAIDRSGGPGEGHVYGIWQRFFNCCGLGFNVLTRSVDGGASFEPPAPVSFSPTFGTMAVGPEGELYAAGIDGSLGQNFNTFVVARSTDAKFAFSTPTFTASFVDLDGSMGIQLSPNPAGLLGQANVAVDRSSGPSRGNVYLLASVEPRLSSDPLEVRFARSVDGGSTWSAPIRVNDDPVGENNWQWFGALSVASNGRIDAIWNDTRNSGLANLSQLFYAYSYDEGDTWSENVPVSPSFDSHLGWPNQNKIGDYYTLFSDATGADVAYAATFNGEQDVYYVRLFPDCNGNAVSDVIDLATGTSPDCNANEIPDECEAAFPCAAAGQVPAQLPEMPLRVTQVGGDLALTWGISCAAGDNDYEVYEGTIGVFTSHAPRACSTGGLTAIQLTPSAGDTYYLVVPRNAFREGSYGTDGGGLERRQGQSACLPQEIAACPAGG